MWQVAYVFETSIGLFFLELQYTELHLPVFDHCAELLSKAKAIDTVYQEVDQVPRKSA